MRERKTDRERERDRERGGEASGKLKENLNGKCLRESAL